jgi:DNA-binding MarR family transcriptional regulator
MDEHLTLGLDKVIHQKARLGIMSILAAGESADFNELKRRLKMTDGNLSTHLGLLEREDYIEIEKTFVRKKPRTLCRLTKKGRGAFSGYLEQLEAVIHSLPHDFPEDK